MTVGVLDHTCLGSGKMSRVSQFEDVYKPNPILIVFLWIIGGVAGAIMHANDILEPLGGLHMYGWVAEGAGCILGGGLGFSRKQEYQVEKKATHPG
eukprot:7549422-Pyramimonas_sp.AAC.2